jgi:hypothetical protein
MGEKIFDIKPEFVEPYMPPNSELQDGILYISMEFELAVHRCCCGCGRKTSTPFNGKDGGDDWNLTINGDLVSLSPSIGNWQMPCRSHYFIRNNKVEWC